ncbi:protein IQ-DOMAIN 13-like isoform X2 [Mangifera indica]|nr:protein IQ-DOMAIN 13-like isoform X2 [Mangifera indica]
MGKKGSWFSAIKKIFLPHSKEKLANESDKKSTKEKKKKGLAKLRRGETNSFIPLFREPSSIEKILGDAEREHNLVFRPPTPPEQPRTPPFVPTRVASPRVPSQRISSPRAASPRAASPRILQQHRERPEPTLRYRHACATKIQAAYKGYMARRSFRALKGLVRLQGVLRGQNVKRQTVNAMKCMQLLVRVQCQIQSRRIQMLENQARLQAQYRNDKETESTLGKWTFSQASEAGNEDWNASALTKEETEARMQRKVEAAIKRERATAYAYSHQLWKTPPKSAQTSVGVLPWWWKWLERQLPQANPSESQSIKSFQLTPPTPMADQHLKPSPRAQSSCHNRYSFGFDMDTPTPKSTKSTILPAARYARSPALGKARQGSPGLSKYSRARASGAPSPFNLPFKDDNSLTSCPPFSVPNYMTPTVSAKAKARANSNPRERFPGTPSSESQRRLSFPLTPSAGSQKWKRGTFFSDSKESSSQRALDKNQSMQSIGNLSEDSTVSVPATVRRKPFNRFV